MAALWLLVLALGYVAVARSQGCYDGCDCDAENKVIRCHASEKIIFEIPDTPIRGYKFIDFTCNDLKTLPKENLLLRAFPNLQGIDVKGNPNFDCARAEASREVAVLSDCGEPEDKWENCEIVHTTVILSDNCRDDWMCRNLQALQELWKRLKEKLGVLFKDSGAEKLAHSIGHFFKNNFKDLSKHWDDMKTLKN